MYIFSWSVHFFLSDDTFFGIHAPSIQVNQVKISENLEFFGITYKDQKISVVSRIFYFSVDHDVYGFVLNIVGHSEIENFLILIPENYL